MGILSGHSGFKLIIDAQKCANTLFRVVGILISFCAMCKNDCLFLTAIVKRPL